MEQLCTNFYTPNYMHKFHGLPITILISIQKGPPVFDRRGTRYWIVLAELTIYFYSTYGEQRPRFVMPIADCTVSPEMDKLDQATIRVTLLDKRSYVFDFETRNDALAFEFNIVESQKFYDTGNSMHVKGRRFEQMLRPFFSDLQTQAAPIMNSGATK